MAVVLAFRLAIALTPVVFRAASSGQPSTLQHLGWLTQALWRRLSDENESDEDLSVALSDAAGYPVTVTTFTGEFSLRKLQVEFRLQSGGADVDDARIVTFHFAKTSGGSVVDTWDAADFTAIENAFDALWTTLKAQQYATIRLSQYRWYKAGPSIVPPQEPVRVVDKNVPGTLGTTALPGGLPPQAACSITERTASRKAWGRLYWPLTGTSLTGSTAVIGIGQRFTSTFLTDIANAFDTFYEACLAATKPVVVYSPAKPERPKKPSGTLPAIGARALTVDTIQVDDVPDVIRSRRWKSALLKVQRAVGS